MRKKLSEEQKGVIAYHERQIKNLEYKIEQHKKRIEEIKKDANFKIK